METCEKRRRGPIQPRFTRTDVLVGDDAGCVRTVGALYCAGAKLYSSWAVREDTVLDAEAGRARLTSTTFCRAVETGDV